MSTLNAVSLNKAGTTVKGIHVDRQHRHLIEQRLSKVTTKGQTVVTYKIKKEGSGQERRLILKGCWSELDWLTPNTLVNIVGQEEPDENGCFILDRDKGYLIVEPDKLVSATSVISQMFCERKSALVSRFFMGAGDNVHIFRGVLAHEVICKAMAESFEGTELLELAKNLCAKPEMLERAYGIGMTDGDLAKIQENVAQWVDRFMKQRWLKKTDKMDPKYQPFNFCELLGVEDNIWNPTYGLKGKIDATVLIQKEKADKKVIVPLEFKTGSTKPQKRQNLKADHMGQVALYTLMMNIKYGSIEDGILYYISDDTLSVHPAKTIELQQLILMRNRYIHSTTLFEGELKHLPRPNGVDYDFQCKNCEARNICTADLRKQNLPEEVLGRTEKSLLQSITLSDEEFHFFNKWLFVINAETEEVEKKFNERFLWTKTPEEREEAGTCLTNLKISAESRIFHDTRGKNIHLFSFTKVSSNSNSQNQNDIQVIPYTFHVDDFVVLSSNVEVNISYGVVMMIRDDEITLMLEQPLHQGYFDTDFKFCIDKVNSNSPIASQFGYLVKLMESSDHAARLREYIIKKKQPKFLKVQVPEGPVQKILEELNGEQKRVIMKSLATDSFLFVRGCPGSGKTTTIVCLIRALVASGKTVLVASYTGTALENILLKYKKYSQNFIKISSSSNSNKELSEYTTKHIVKNKNITSIDELTKAYEAPIVGTTLLSLKHAIFQVRRFDYCIVDEASQALPTAVLGALAVSNKYIVFGDPQQLPPVIQSSLVKSADICDNFFSLMATAVSTVKLNIQYRMNAAIAKLANQLMYCDQMRCATEEQAKSYVNLRAPDIRAFLTTRVSCIEARRILCFAVSKVYVKAVAFMDTSELSAFERRIDETVANDFEKDITIACTRLFVESKMDPKKIGIIAPYRGQVKLLRNTLKSMKEAIYHDIEVNTVDQYQGREMEVIICSFTKSLPNGAVTCPTGETTQVIGKEGILEDMRRLNVAITRARNKLVLIGNRNTLERYTPFQKLFEILQPEQLEKVSQEQFDGLKQLVIEGISVPTKSSFSDRIS